MWDEAGEKTPGEARLPDTKFLVADKNLNKINSLLPILGVKNNKNSGLIRTKLIFLQVSKRENIFCPDKSPISGIWAIWPCSA